MLVTLTSGFSDSDARSLKLIGCKIRGFHVHEDSYCSILECDVLTMTVVYFSEMMVSTYQSVH
jgi:hypothetical protein